MSTKIGNQVPIPLCALLRVLEGVGVATKTSDHIEALRATWPSFRSSQSQAMLTHHVAGSSNGASHNPSISLLLHEWNDQITSDIRCEKARQLVKLALGVAFLRERGRLGLKVVADDLSFAWMLISGAIRSSEMTNCSVNRSAQGFLAVPLCSLIQNGQIDELFRLHVWLPDGKRGNPSFAIHSHQAFAQSWILAGSGKDSSYDLDLDCDLDTATHAFYKLSWTSEDKKSTNTAYKTHQSSSTVVNTGKLARSTLSACASHTRDMTYTIPSAAFHTTEVPQDTLHATLFFFDASRGFEKDAGVLGPKNAESYTQFRDQDVGLTPQELTELVQLIRSWEAQMAQGQLHQNAAEWEQALREYGEALGLCERIEAFPLPRLSSYRQSVLGQLDGVSQRLGRYAQAADFLEKALSVNIDPSLQRVDITGELEVAYRHMNHVREAKKTVE
jgi:hypothetical protein